MPELHFSRQGAGEPLVLLHGLFGSGKNWQSLARLFARHFEVFTVDQRNHGLSFHAEEMTYRLMADDLRALLGHLELGPCHILGHSMGGKVAMMLAFRHPEMLARLIVADIAPVRYFHHYDDLIDPVLAISLAQLESRAEADQMLRANIPEDQLRAFILQNLAREPNGWRWRVNWRVIQSEMDYLTGFDDLSPAWFVECPSLFIRGANSDYVGDREIELIKRYFHRPEVTTIDHAGHWLHAEQPGLFAQSVLGFLQT